MFINNRVLFAQQWCGTASPETLLFTSTNGQNKSNNNPVCINVKFHIVRQTNGTGGFNPANISNILNRINGDYNEHNIFFKNTGVDFVDNDDYFNLTAAGTPGLMLENHTSTAFNFYIVNSAPYTGVSVSNNEFYVIASAATTSVSSHEIGHSFGLYHTHENVGGVETIPRSGVNANCDVAGDLLCDTPADPNLIDVSINDYKVDMFCNYFYNETYLGENYNPDTNNIMSYSRPNCLISFTTGQANRMHHFINTIPTLQNIVSNTCELPEIIGSNAICNNNQKTYTLIISVSSANWLVSTNLAILSSNNNSVTVTPVANAIGQATITANINGYIVEKNITITGNPQITNHTIQGGADNVTFNSTHAFTVQSVSGNANYVWTIVPNYNYSGQQPEINGASGNTVTTGTYITVNYGTCAGIYRLRCKAVNACGIAYYTDREINVYNPDTHNTCSNKTSRKLNMYPNPSKEENVTLKLDYIENPCDNENNKTTGFLVEVYNIYGVLVYQKQTNYNQLKIPTSTLNTGVYFVLLKTENEYLEKKNLMIK